jgi:CheY-like chemotaxis protein
MNNELRIMVVDDDREELDRTLAAIRGHGLGYEARIALGCFEALDYLLGRGRFHERRRHPLPDVLCLDLGMAPLDGVAVMRHIKKVEGLRRIPVILLCNSEAEGQRALRDIVGTCICAVKPLTSEILHDLLLIVAPWSLELRRNQV